MTYVDGFVAAVPRANRDAYREHAAKAAEIFKDHGALMFVECWGDDVPEGKVTDFYRAVKAKEDEEIIFSWITWADRAARDAGIEKVMADPRMEAESMEMPFDGKRMIFGGFEMLLDL